MEQYLWYKTFLSVGDMELKSLEQGKQLAQASTTTIKFSLYNISALVLST